uniref:Small RNA 2'-O-methyltransferase n=2 Tax=Ceratitis capitata TaxID=7213 RepID=W8BMQ4_CERCA
MFSYKLPQGGLNSLTIFNDAGDIRFDPPVYELRYTTTVRILEDPRWGLKFKKVVEFGCADMRFLPLLRRTAGVEHILEVDIDEDILRSNKQKAEPLITDYLQRRETPLRIEVLKGSIDASVQQLINADAVVALEIIEHLYPKTMESVPKNIFGFIQPKIAIFTTPNSDFNVLFNLLPNGFRHDDHKFEWSRAEFKEWALNICKEYPNYRVAFLGVGKAPPDKKKIGHVSQIAIFARCDILHIPLAEALHATDASFDCNPDPDVQYKEIFAVDFPVNIDERSKEEKILHEARYQMDRCRRIERYFNRDLRMYQVPLTVLEDYIKYLNATMEELIAVLKANNIEVSEDYILLPEYDEDDLSYRQYDDYYDDSCGYFGGEVENDDELGACGGRSYAKDDVTYDSEENWD